MFFPERIRSIKPGDRVLEIGPGGTPHPRADVFLELDPRFLEDREISRLQRGSAPELKTDKPIAYYDGRKFPFKNKEFDYVICSHVLEHVEDLELFLSEMFRVAKRGYIEYPTIYYEYLYNIPVHYKLLRFKNGTLFYLNKSKSSLDEFKGVQRLLLDTLDSGRTQLVDSLKEIMIEGFEWLKPFPYRESWSVGDFVLEDYVLPGLQGSISAPLKIPSVVVTSLSWIYKAVYHRLTGILGKVPVLRRFVDKPKTSRSFVPDDISLVNQLKGKFIHNDRAFHYSEDQFTVDCLYCHAVPGTLEQIILDLTDLYNKGKVGKKLLNVGGGTGQVSEVFREVGFDVFNLDIEVKREDRRNVRFDLNWTKDLPYRSNFFDVIICQEIAEHIESPWNLFRKVKRVLKPKGFLFLTTPNIQSSYSKKIFSQTGYFDWFKPENFSYHINALPSWEVEMVAKANGFSLVAIKGNGDYYFNRSSTIPREEILAKNEGLIFIFQKK